MTQQATKTPQATRAAEELICHCRRVPYETVEQAVRSGEARTLAEVQRATTACTRCFGCRFEVESVLQRELGEAYKPAAAVTREEPEQDRLSLRRRLGRRLLRARGALPPPVPQKMYMPLLQGFGGLDVSTRIVLFNLHDEREEEPRPVSLRADITRLDGTREDVWRTTVGPKQTTILEVGDLLHDGSLPDGLGVVKLVLDSDAVRSLRPYFQFVSPGGITSTHEKRGPKQPDRVSPRRYHWVFPVGPRDREYEAWFFLANTQTVPLEGRSLAYRDTEGNEQSVDLPTLALDQAACIPLHEHFEAIRDGSARGTVRLTPPWHVAGWILRRDVEADVWLVQHL